MNVLSFTVLFAILVVASTAAQMWLSARQLRFVAQHRDTVPPQFSGTIPLAAHQKAADYTVAKARFGFVELAIGTAVLVAWTLLGGLNALNDAMLGWLGSGLWQQVALIVAFSVIGGLIELPLSLYQTFVLEERFGFNKITFRLWLVDALKSALLGVLIGVPLLATVLWLMAATGPLWWLWTWSFWMAFTLVLMVVYPAFIAPLFNKFKPLEDDTLKQRVVTLMERCGFHAKGLFVMDGSKRSAHSNAYFTGFGAAKRVVFYDTLLSRLSHDEVEGVLAHELGHFHHKHIIKRIISMALISLLGLAALGYLSQQLWFYAGLGVTPNLTGGNEAIALLLFMMVVPLFSFWLTPLSSLVSRRHEFQADAFACTHASGAHLTSALLKLYEDNASTLTPDPLYVAFYYSHPPAVQRIERMTRGATSVPMSLAT
jgi:STE24 endopeptidase